MDTIAFKLPDDLSKKLEATAPKAKGMSRHKHAKQIVINYLKATEHVKVKDELNSLRKDVKRLRSDLASSVQVLLVMAGKVATSEEANKWVETHLV